MKIVTIVGARPQFIKAAMVSRAILEHNKQHDAPIEEWILHTGQHYAVAFIVWQESSAYYLVGGGNPELKDSGAHSLLPWERIRFSSQYMDVFDLKGSTIQGIERFFRKFRAIQMPYFTITKGNLSLLYRA